MTDKEKIIDLQNRVSMLEMLMGIRQEEGLLPMRTEIQRLEIEKIRKLANP